MTLSTKEAQGRLPDLLDLVAQGEDVKITSGDGSITCRLVMVARKTVERVADLHPDALVMSHDFDEDDPEINAMFYGDRCPIQVMASKLAGGDNVPARGQ